MNGFELRRAFENPDIERVDVRFTARQRVRYETEISLPRPVWEEFQRLLEFETSTQISAYMAFIQALAGLVLERDGARILSDGRFEQIWLDPAGEIAPRREEGA